jgi:hypothetical protein
MLVETFHISTHLTKPERLENLYTAIEVADLVILAFPLYVDSLPAPTIDLLERIAARRAGNTTTQRLVAISNCGFPEAFQIDTALAICGRFAQEAGFQWAGGFALGGGGRMNGRPVDEMGDQGMPLRQAFALAAEALAAGDAVPQAALDMFARWEIPSRLYRAFGNNAWTPLAKQYGAEKRLRARPYPYQ